MIRLVSLALALYPSVALAALNPGPDDLYVRVVDNGPGLCAIIKIPNDNYIVYDAGHWHQGHRCVDAAKEIIGDNTIELMILSHADADHLADGDDILKHFRVNQIIRTGDRRTTGTWKNANDAIGEEAKHDATVINLQTSTLKPGTELAVGPATVTLVFGLGKWTQTTLSQSERRNAISIVARLDHEDHSILFTGDTVGRRIGDSASACKDAESIMVNAHNGNGPTLKSDVIIAPHHGANNGNSTCFIEAVNPSHVVFSAGHQHGHPRNEAAQRYISHGVAVGKMFRTDRGDDEGAEEWDHGRIQGCKDPRGDDDVEIVLPQSGAVQVDYRLPASGC